MTKYEKRKLKNIKQKRSFSSDSVFIDSSLECYAMHNKLTIFDFLFSICVTSPCIIIFYFFIFFYGADAIYFPISISSFFAILLILPVEPSHRKNRQIADIHDVLYCLSVRYNVVWR